MWFHGVKMKPKKSFFSVKPPISIAIILSLWPHQLSDAGHSQDLMTLKFLPEIHCLFFFFFFLYKGLQATWDAWISIAAYQLSIYQLQLPHWTQEALMQMNSLLPCQFFLWRAYRSHSVNSATNMIKPPCDNPSSKLA